jgi:hypothetical protein
MAALAEGDGVTGAEIASAILEAAAFGGWRRVHFRPGRTSAGWRTSFTGSRGFPDLVMARRGQVLCLKLKGDRDPVREGQAEWLDDLGGPRSGSVVAAGFVTAAELDITLRFLVGQASEAELRAALAARWTQAVGP